MFRAFFALPPSIRDRDGRPTNAVHGYLEMTARLLAEHRPDGITHVFDSVLRPDARVRAYPAYKAARPPDPDGLPEQFELLGDVLDALGAERAVAEGWEADDAIGALCTAADLEDRIDVVTGDRDLLQLVCDRPPVVRVLFTVRGVSELAVFDEVAVEAKYGVAPRRYADFATLRGDPSDGLPGVPGVGEKTARRLVATSPSLDALLDAADRQPATLARRLREARAYLEAMRSVVPIRTDVKVTIQKGPRADDRLRALAERGGLHGPIRRLTAALDQGGTLRDG